MKIYTQNNSIRFEGSIMSYNTLGCSIDVDLNDGGLLFLNHSIKLFGGYRFNYAEIEDSNGVFFTSYIDVLTYLNGLLTACSSI